MSDFVPFAARSGTMIDLGLVTPKASRYDRPGEMPKHKVRILVPKSDTAALTAIKQAQDQALAAKGLLGKPGVRLLLQDGDETDKSGVRLHPEHYSGMAFFTASAKPERPPTLQVGREKRAPGPQDFYSGAQVAFAGSAFGYDMGASKGCSALISLVWMIGPGKRIASSGGDAADQLGDLDVSWSADDAARKDLMDQVKPQAGGDDLASFFQ